MSVASPNAPYELALAPLPLQLTSFVGREQEVREIGALLQRDDVHLLTLTGAGGIGKTRVAIRAAEEVMHHFEGGVVFVALAPLVEPATVLPAVADALGVPEMGDRSVLDRIARALRHRPILLVLDNFEQVIDAAIDLPRLCALCPDLTLLVTSREVLRVTGEREFNISPLPLVEGPLGDIETARDTPSLRLFVERARAVRPDLILDDVTGPSIAAICRRLDGLPLAIELAAARARILSPQAILARLDHRLPFLTAGARDLAPRQQAMATTIAWSYDLMTQEEQTHFRRLAVFVGGFTLDAAEIVADRLGDGETGERFGRYDRHADPHRSVLDVVASLVDKSLLRPIAVDDETRYAMLETVREFALEQLEASGESAFVRDRHAAWCLDLAEQGPTVITQTGDNPAWMRRVDAERDNLRAALTWFMRRADPALAGRLVSALRTYWFGRSHLTEGLAAIEDVLARLDPASSEMRARLLVGAAAMDRLRGNPDRAIERLREAAAFRRQLGDRVAESEALCLLLRALIDTDRVDAIDSTEQELVDVLGDIDHPNLRMAIHATLGLAAYRRGDLAKAELLLTAAFAMARDIQSPFGIAVSATYLALVAFGHKQAQRAAELLTESILVLQHIGMTATLANTLASASAVVATYGRAEHAARLLGLTTLLMHDSGLDGDLPDQAHYDLACDLVRRQLGDQGLADGVAAGRETPLAHTVAVATELLLTVGSSAAPESDAPTPGQRDSPDLHGLTERELDVLALLVEGYSDRAIAEALFISWRTVQKHVANICGKFGVNSRTAAVTAAIRAAIVPIAPTSSPPANTSS